MTKFTITEDFPKNEIEFDHRFSDPKAWLDCFLLLQFVSQPEQGNVRSLTRQAACFICSLK